MRALLRAGGEPVRLRCDPPPVRPRRLVLLVDVSGSMSAYADALLRFAHAAAAAAAPRTEVFTLGTRLTRVTREMRQPRPGAGAGRGRRRGPGLVRRHPARRRCCKAFLDRWGQRGAARGAVVVIVSDGWERGDAGRARRSRWRGCAGWRTGWSGCNPHAGRPGYAPLTGGMVAALPYVDDFVAGHSLAALERLAEVVAGGRCAHA